MSINDDDAFKIMNKELDVSKVYDALKEVDKEVPEENPVSINSKGDISTKTDAASLKEALQTLVKYAKMLEEKEADDKEAWKQLDVGTEETEEDVPNED